MATELRTAVRSEGGRWGVFSSEGNHRLGTHATEAEARAQSLAIEAKVKREARTAEAPKGEMRDVHLRCALSASRTEIVNGREYLVVPVVALMEGVIHAVNAETPERVPIETLQKAAATWNGRPVTLGHPKTGGKQCSASHPEALGLHIGEIKNSHISGKKLLQEAWIDKEKAKLLDAEMLQRLSDNKTEEVSVGAYVVTDGIEGKLDDKPYKASWLLAAGDHLAFLPGGRGACSIEMGCGTHRAAMNLVMAEAIEMVTETTQTEMPECLTFTALAEVDLNERISAIYDAVNREFSDPPQPVTPSNYAYTEQVFDDRVIVRKGDEVFSVDYTVDKDGKVTLGTAKPVKRAWVAASGFKAAAGARHSTGDMRLIQAMHDSATELGAKCDRSNYKMLTSAALCSCGGHK